MLCEALDKKKEVRVVFCDISKAFDRVWHEGLLYKLERMGISGALLLWFKSYISNRKQKVIIENSSSKTGDIQAGVPQGSVLGPLLFLIDINDITENVNSHIRIFADDTTLFIDFSDEITATQQINNDLATIRDWADRWLVSFCPKKTEALLVSLKHRTNPPPPIYFGQTRVTEVESHKHLGMILNNNLSWNEHIDQLVIKAGRRLGILSYLMYRLDRKSLEKMYISYVRPILEYGDIMFSNMTGEQSLLIENVNKGPVI